MYLTTESNQADLGLDPFVLKINIHRRRSFLVGLMNQFFYGIIPVTSKLNLIADPTHSPSTGLSFGKRLSEGTVKGNIRVVLRNLNHVDDRPPFQVN